MAPIAEERDLSSGKGGAGGTRLPVSRAANTRSFILLSVGAQETDVIMASLLIAAPPPQDKTVVFALLPVDSGLALSLSVAEIILNNKQALAAAGHWK